MNPSSQPTEQKPPYEHVTLETLARRLGVSAATISKALSGKGRIGEETRLKVQRLADELGYVPDAMARSLQKKVNDTVGLLLLGNIENSWYSKIVSDISGWLDDLGRTMMLSVGGGVPSRLRHVISSFIGSRVQGIIAGPVGNDEAVEEFRPALNRCLPIVFFGNLRPLPHNFVTPDQEYGGFLAAEYLLGLGHRRIAFAGWSHEPSTAVGTRFRGYCEQLKKYSLQPELIIPSRLEVSRHSAYQLACDKIIPLPPEQRPTAIFCHNDDMAIGIMLALQQHGLRIPEEISIMGFDDIDEAAFACPNLTTIGGLKEVFPGELCQALLKAVEKPDEIVVQRFLRPRLVIRNSTAAPHA